MFCVFYLHMASLLFSFFSCFWYILVCFVRLLVPVQVIAWKDSCPKWPIMCRVGRKTLLTHWSNYWTTGLSFSNKDELTQRLSFKTAEVAVSER